jgi:hypothetical protein
MIMARLHLALLRSDAIDCRFSPTAADALHKAITPHCIWRSDEGHVRALYWVERSWGTHVETK